MSKRLHGHIQTRVHICQLTELSGIIKIEISGKTNKQKVLHAHLLRIFIW